MRDLRYRSVELGKEMQSDLLCRLGFGGKRIFWWNKANNFGDRLTRELLAAYGIRSVHTGPEKAEFVGIGSLLHLLPRNSSATILGSGCIDDRLLELEGIETPFVRGELTKKALRLPHSTETGDLGLLASKLIRSSEQRPRKVGLIPHYVDKTHPLIVESKDYFGQQLSVIDVAQSATSVARQIIQCTSVVSSSLHGMIFADALGVPAAWISLSDKIIGGEFKFLDYLSSINFERPRIRPKNISDVRTAIERCSSPSKQTLEMKKRSLEYHLLAAIKSPA